MLLHADELPLASQTHGELRENLSVEGKPLQIPGKIYAPESTRFRRSRSAGREQPPRIHRVHRHPGRRHNQVTYHRNFPGWNKPPFILRLCATFTQEGNKPTRDGKPVTWSDKDIHR